MAPPVMHEPLPVGEVHELEGEEREDALWEHWHIDVEPGRRRSLLLQRLRDEMRLYELATAPTQPMPMGEGFPNTQPADFGVAASGVE